jgi:hypothetical protein
LRPWEKIPAVPVIDPMSALEPDPPQPQLRQAIAGNATADPHSAAMAQMAMRLNACIASLLELLA